MRNDLFFEPWTGTKYEPFDIGAFTREAPSLYPTHILGESHYDEQYECCPTFTREVIEHRAIKPSVDPFFPNPLKLVTGQRLEDIDRHDA